MADVAVKGVRRPHGKTTTALPGVVDAVKALAHPGRLRVLAMLRGGDLCVCQLTSVLELAASTVSSHLSDLRRAGLVAERRDGKWVHYHLVDRGPLADLVGRALQLLDDDERLKQDARVVGELRRIPLDAFCRTGLGGRTVRRVPRPSRPQGTRGSRMSARVSRG